MSTLRIDLSDADHLLAGQKPAKPYHKTQAFKEGVHEGVKRLDLFLSSTEGRKGIRLIQLSRRNLPLFTGSYFVYSLDCSGKWLRGPNSISVEVLVHDFGFCSGCWPEDIATFVAMRLHRLAAELGLKA